MKSVFKHILVFLITFGLAGAGAFYAIRMFTQSADEVVLPELAGKNIIYVLETLTNMGLNAKLHSTLYDESIPRYAVISQSPAPGTTIKKGRDVVIYLSKGKKQTLMPDLRLIPLEHARILLEKNQFESGHLSYAYSASIPKNKIIAQYPEPFSTAFKGIFCDLLISRGNKLQAWVMPDIKDLPIESISGIMDTNHLVISKILSNINRKKNQGIVLSQDPEAGSFVTYETPITLTVNALKKDQSMSPNLLNRIIMLTHSLEPGFLKFHVRIETDMFGPLFDLYNEHMKPGKNIHILVPAGNKSNFNIFIDHKLVKIITIDPWDKDNTTGDIIPWESSPLQFYQPISQN